MHRNKFIVLSVLLLAMQSSAQDSLGQLIPFRDPLSIPIQLAANFGEIRVNHYHMGLDIRTQQRENLPVFAADDGYISRVYISPLGYGNMLMVTHPNGYTTLYAHLNTFMQPLADYVKEKQYKDRSWEQDFTLAPQQFPVRKGQQIALSGNTGGSEGPHLHFEIRNTKTGKQQNPLLMGMYVPDSYPPEIYGLAWYDRRYSTYQSGPRLVSVSGGNGKYVSAPIKVGTPLVSFGIRSQDRTNNSPFRFGIYQAVLKLDGKTLFSFALTNFDNEQSRYVNACIDYKFKMQGGSYIQHLSRLEGNRLPVFSGTNGIIGLSDTLPHTVEIAVSDPKGNTSVLNTVIQFDPSLQKDVAIDTGSVFVRPGHPGRIYSPHADFIFSENTFYDNVPFRMTESNPGSALQVSPTIHLDHFYIPVHDYYTIGVEYDASKGLENKEHTVMQLKSAGSTTVVKGSWSGNRMIGKFNRLGDVRLLVDSVPPRILPVGWKAGSVLPASVRRIAVNVVDNLSGIARFEATLDNNWLLFVQKGGRYTYTMDEHFPLGTHLLSIKVTDVAGNVSEQHYLLTRK